MLTVSSAALTHVGVRRPSNEDSLVARQGLGLFVVCDGMGGHAAGEVASRAAADTIEAFIEHSEGANADLTWPYGFRPELGIDGNRLVSAFLLANREIYQRVADEPSLRGMATTGVALLLGRCAPDSRSSECQPCAEQAAAGDQSGTTAGAAARVPSPEPRLPADRPLSGSALVAHVGDSRAYLWREGVLEQITRDHSWVEEQIAAGALSEDEARQHPWRNLVTRALAGAEPPEVDVTPVALERGDRILLCSDGLTTPLTDQTIQETMNRVPKAGPEAICQALVDAANAAGGPDNITVIVVEVS
jgi:serine/threonine protein phosphatase PrpC